MWIENKLKPCLFFVTAEDLSCPEYAQFITLFVAIAGFNSLSTSRYSLNIQNDWMKFKDLPFLVQNTMRILPRSPKWKCPLSSSLDCEQSLSFPRVARVAKCEGRARAARSAGAEEKEKERDCGGILIFSICRLWQLFDWWFRLVLQSEIVNNSSVVLLVLNGVD